MKKSFLSFFFSTFFFLFNFSNFIVNEIIYAIWHYKGFSLKYENGEPTIYLVVIIFLTLFPIWATFTSTGNNQCNTVRMQEYIYTSVSRKEILTSLIVADNEVASYRFLIPKPLSLLYDVSLFFCETKYKTFLFWTTDIFLWHQTGEHWADESEKCWASF